MSRALGRETPPAPPSFALPLCLPRTRGLLSQNHYPLRILAVVCPNYLGRRPPTSSASPRLLLNARAQAFRIRQGCCLHWLRRHCLCRCGCRRRRSKEGWLKGRGHSHSPLGAHALRGGGLRKSGPAASTAPKCKSNFLGRFCCNVLSWASAKLEHKMHRMVLQDPESTTSFPQLVKHQRPSTRSRPKTGYARGGWCFRCF